MFKSRGNRHNESLRKRRRAAEEEETEEKTGELIIPEKSHRSGIASGSTAATKVSYGKSNRCRDRTGDCPDHNVALIEFAIMSCFSFSHLMTASGRAFRSKRAKKSLRNQ